MYLGEFFMFYGYESLAHNRNIYNHNAVLNCSNLLSSITRGKEWHIINDICQEHQFITVNVCQDCNDPILSQMSSTIQKMPPPLACFFTFRLKKRCSFVSPETSGTWDRGKSARRAFCIPTHALDKGDKYTAALAAHDNDPINSPQTKEHLGN